MNLWLQITAGQGPAECQWVVAQVMALVQQEAAQQQIACRLVEATPGQRDSLLRSVLLGLDGPGAAALAGTWEGTVQWIGPSPYRPRHKRKNWFVGVEVFRPAAEVAWSESELRVDVMRSSGPGGQHVNKSSSAVRVTHVPTGLSAVAQEERSQHQNRRLALARLARLFAQQQTAAEAGARRQRWQGHAALQRGNPVRVYRGPRFERDERG